MKPPFITYFFPFALRIVQSRNPTNLPAGRTPEPFRLEAKSERHSFKGHKTFLLTTLRNIKNFYAKIALDRLPMLLFVLLAKGEKIPLWGSDSLLQAKRKKGQNLKNQRGKRK